MQVAQIARRLLARRRRPAAPRDGQEEAEEMVEHRAIFREGAAKKGIPEPKANEIFDLMEKFAGYGFNKSHAAAYALLAYHTAYLKVHYPAEFIAANMSVALDDTDKLQDLPRRRGGAAASSFEPPDVNTGGYRFEPVGRQGGALRPGRDQGHGAGRDRGDHRRARARAAPFTSPVRLLRTASTAAASTSAPSRR